MSTGLELLYIEEAESVWWYLLENWDSPKGGWDWRESATLYGPFTTEDEADAHRRDNHANPGGYQTTSYKDQYPFTPDATFERLKVEAAERVKTEAAARAYRPYRW